MTEQKEGFCLMIYRCTNGHTEIIWNSRDGITPFTIGCRKCMEPINMSHIAWEADVCVPDFKPPKGMRIFVDLTMEKALKSREAYVAKWWDRDMEAAFGTREAAVLELAKGDLESFAPHTPDLVEVT